MSDWNAVFDHDIDLSVERADHKPFRVFLSSGLFWLISLVMNTLGISVGLEK